MLALLTESERVLLLEPLRWLCCWLRAEKSVLMRRGGPREEPVGPPELLETERADAVPCSVSEESEVRWLLLWCEVLVLGAVLVEVPLAAVFAPLRASRVPPIPLVKPVPLPPPAAMAAALKIAAAFLPSRISCSRSTHASKRPSTWYGRASCRREHRICGVQREDPATGRDEV